MQWKGRRRSSNVEDRRGQGSGSPGRGFGIPIGGGMGGIGLIILLVIFLLRSGFLGDILGSPQQDPGFSNQPQVQNTSDDMGNFASVVLADTEDVWTKLFSESQELREYNISYIPPKMVLFEDATQSACGFASSTMGPFYCPLDQKVYIDLSFYSDLKNRFGVSGDYAMAYVIAHEVGHHIQNLLGITDWMQKQQATLSKAEYNKLSVRLELQADYLAGVFTKHQGDQGYLDPGDIEEAMRAAEAIGDDRIQKQTQGRVIPDSFTHGTSEQRMRWFRKGLENGTLQGGDTFEIPYQEL